MGFKPLYIYISIHTYINIHSKVENISLMKENHTMLYEIEQSLMHP
jgi:hypothetical protein